MPMDEWLIMSVIAYERNWQIDIISFYEFGVNLER